METHEVGGSASPHGGRATETQSPSVRHRPRIVDGDRAPCTTDQQAEHVSRQEPHADDVDRAPCTTDPHKEQEPRLEPQDEARAASARRTSFKTSSVPSRSAERVLPSKTTGRPRSSESVSRVTSQALGVVALTSHSCSLPSKPPGSAESVEPAVSALGRSASDKPGRSAFHATQLRSSPSDLPVFGPHERVIETAFPPRIPLLPDLARARRMAASDAATREIFPRRDHKHH